MHVTLFALDQLGAMRIGARRRRRRSSARSAICPTPASAARLAPRGARAGGAGRRLSRASAATALPQFSGRRAPGSCGCTPRARRPQLKDREALAEAGARRRRQRARDRRSRGCASSPATTRTPSTSPQLSRNGLSDPARRRRSRSMERRIADAGAAGAEGRMAAADRAKATTTRHDARDAIAKTLTSSGRSARTGASRHRQPRAVSPPHDQRSQCRGPAAPRVAARARDDPRRRRLRARAVHLAGARRPSSASRTSRSRATTTASRSTASSPNFVIQGGSPAPPSTSATPRFMRDEVGLWPHVRGAVGISTRGHDTGDAQIFVDLVDNPRLDHDVHGLRAGAERHRGRRSDSRRRRDRTRRNQSLVLSSWSVRVLQPRPSQPGAESADRRRCAQRRRE